MPACDAMVFILPTTTTITSVAAILPGSFKAVLTSTSWFQASKWSPSECKHNAKLLQMKLVGVGDMGLRYPVCLLSLWVTLSLPRMMNRIPKRRISLQEWNKVCNLILERILYALLDTELMIYILRLKHYENNLPKIARGDTRVACMWLKVNSLLLTEHHAMKTYWGTEGIAPRILNLGTRWRWVVSFAPRPLYL
jgi:hypothetical protein